MLQPTRVRTACDNCGNECGNTTTSDGVVYRCQCRFRWYCTSSCQNEDWGKHKYDCRRTQTCDTCHKIHWKLSICSGCNVRWYCSTICQKKDWKDQHKYACKPPNFGGQYLLNDEVFVLQYLQHNTSLGITGIKRLVLEYYSSPVFRLNIKYNKPSDIIWSKEGNYSMQTPFERVIAFLSGMVSELDMKSIPNSTHIVSQEPNWSEHHHRTRNCTAPIAPFIPNISVLDHVFNTCLKPSHSTRGNDRFDLTDTQSLYVSWSVCMCVYVY